MCFFARDSDLVVTNLLYQAALLIAVIRWVSSWILHYMNRSERSCWVPTQTIKDSLVVTKFGEIRSRWVSDTCAVCLRRMEGSHRVREMRNCCHVFHRECVDRWIDHDDYHDDHGPTCPLCRTPMYSGFDGLDGPKNELNWAVERLLYLFGDDLLAC